MTGQPVQPVVPRVGDKLVVTVSGIAFGGEGVARVEDFVLFIPFVMVGEEAEVEITEVKKRFGRARLLTLRQSAPERVTPPCRYFGACGGCQYQHIEYAAQLRIKQKQIADLFQRVGQFPQADIAPVVPSPQPYGYRNRIMIRSQWDKYKKALNIGFLRHDSRLVVDVEECRIAEPVLNEQLMEVRANPPPRGGLKVMLRMQPEDWELPPDSFFQNNFHLLPKLVETVRDRLQQGGARRLVDVYCGVGFFSLELADLLETYVGVEIDKQAVRAARKNAARRGRTNGEFLEGRAEELLPELIERFDPDQTAVLLDPPRKGCPPETFQILKQARPRQLLYVSCHPATLARDLNILCADGVYELKKVIPLDMFPQTQHVECVADVQRAPGEASGDSGPAGGTATKPCQTA
jgi:tRNA/tmRNA/rRNA uracil-C5-methylase (TrmA/RlmC/RlmD family)